MKSLALATWTDSSGTTPVDHVNDIYAANGQIVLSSGINAYADIVASKIKTILGELQLDKDAGIDYFGTVFSDSSKKGLWASAVVDGIESLDFVISVTEFDSEYSRESNTIRYSATIQTDIGTVELES